MIGGLKPYPVYKESGVPWLGQIPAHWTVARIKSILRELDRRSTDGEGVLLSHAAEGANSADRGLGSYAWGKDARRVQADQQVKMCTELKGKASWFLPFNQGWNDGAGNPPNPYGIQTDYLWKRILTPRGLTNIIENYAQIIEETDPKTGRKKHKQVFPRYQQLDVVRRLLADVAWRGAGKRYLIQHSAGSGKSNSIAWLAHQLIRVRKDGKEVFDSIIVITDRRILDD
jgi:hypothetical protein